MQKYEVGGNVYYCSLLGVVAEKSREKLCERLCGLSENYMQGGEFRVHEMVFARDATPEIPASELRLRKHSRRAEPNGLTWTCDSWTIVHFGSPLDDNPDDPSQVLARPIVEVESSDNAKILLESMGYKMRYEYVIDGMRWHMLPEDMNENKFPYYISIFTILQVLKRSESTDNDANLRPLFNESVVEVYGYAKDKEVSNVANELNNFSNKLVPSVNMMKLDASNIRQLKKIVDSRLG
jgi:hypothetical protein